MEKDRCKQIFQVVCVVHDLDTALANWKRLVDFRQSSIKDISVDCTGMYQSRRIQFRMKAVRFDLGGIDMKLVEPVDKDGCDPYADILRTKGQGFHHLGIYTEDLPDLLGQFAASGNAPVYEELIHGALSAVRSHGHGGLYDGSLCTDDRAVRPQGRLWADSVR